MTESRAAIVLFDGVCGLCNRSVDVLLRLDRHGALRFAPLQSRVGQALLRDRGLDPSEFSSVVVIADGRVYRRSDAVLHAMSTIGGMWRAISAAGRLIPRPLRDLVYDWIATNRYRWFGQRSTCRLPTPEERERFLAD